jgi:glucose-6-phosphate 1-dehydrogenase
MTPILDAWKASPPKDFPNYAAGSWGPKCADELMARDGHEWHTS